MPCYKINTAPSGYGQIGTTGYATEAECLEACKEGACCNGTTCSVKPQCQCDPAQGFGFQGVGTTCSPNPCNVGACCVGATCYQRSEEQCSAGFNIGSTFNPRIVSGAFVGDNVACEPNPCCPTCDPYIYNSQTGRYAGRCCRGTYIADGLGACCPPGRDCCGNVSSVRTDGANGACCPESKPFCCRDPLIPFENQTGRCQQWPRAYDTTEVLPVVGSLDACNDQGALQKTITLPESPFTVDLVAECSLISVGPLQGKGSRYTARFVFGSFEWVTSIDTTQNRQCSGSGFANFCKPAGVTTVTLIVEDLFSEFGICAPMPQIAPAYSLRILGKNPCECNPLP